MRVTADTNTIISGSLWHGNPRRILDAAHDGLIELYTTKTLLKELTEVLGRGKFADKLLASGRAVQDIVKNFAFLATVIEPNVIEAVVLRDPDDDEVIACAVASRSDVIVSGDYDLLDLEEYHGIRILTAAELLDELGLLDRNIEG